MPKGMERVIDQKYPQWRQMERNEDGSARYMPAGVRLVETSLLRHFSADDVVFTFMDTVYNLKIQNSDRDGFRWMYPAGHPTSIAIPSWGASPRGRAKLTSFPFFPVVAPLAANSPAPV